MALFEIGIMALAAGLIFSIAVISIALLLIYRRLNTKMLHIFEELESHDKELRTGISKVNEARVSDSKELGKKMDSIEQKLDALLQPDGQARELAKEKIRVKKAN